MMRSTSSSTRWSDLERLLVALHQHDREHDVALVVAARDAEPRRVADLDRADVLDQHRDGRPTAGARCC